MGFRLFAASSVVAFGLVACDGVPATPCHSTADCVDGICLDGFCTMRTPLSDAGMEPVGSDGGEPDSFVGPPPSEVCGNGLDDDGDGEVDEGCSCERGTSQSCYGGDLAHAGVGECARGTQECPTDTEFSTFGDCTGWAVPTADVCDGLDNDCDGVVDGDCRCEPGATQACASEFPPETGRYSCGDGTATCAAEDTGGSRWGPCDSEAVCAERVDDLIYGETSRARPVDIVIAVDQSGSMSEEIANVRSNLNSYAAALDVSGIDFHVILLAQRGVSGYDICIPAPLGGPGCADTARFMQIDQRVASSNALSLIQTHIDAIESFMRPGSLRAFTVITDDDSSVSASAFDAFLRGRTGYSDYVFDGIIGRSGVCAGTARHGSVYIELAATTGGHIEDICVADWSESFSRFAGELISRTLIYALTETPNPSRPVRVFFVAADGSESEQAEGTVWHYDAGANAVVIHDGHTPADGTPIRVRYGYLLSS